MLRRQPPDCQMQTHTDQYLFLQIREVIQENGLLPSAEDDTQMVERPWKSEELETFAIRVCGLFMKKILSRGGDVSHHEKASCCNKRAPVDSKSTPENGRPGPSCHTNPSKLTRPPTPGPPSADVEVQQGPSSQTNPFPLTHLPEIAPPSAEVDMQHGSSQDDPVPSTLTFFPGPAPPPLPGGVEVQQGTFPPLSEDLAPLQIFGASAGADPSNGQYGEFMNDFLGRTPDFDFVSDETLGANPFTGGYGDHLFPPENPE